MKRQTLGYRLSVLVAQWLLWFFVALVLITAVAAQHMRRGVVADRTLLAQSVAQQIDTALATTFQGLRRLGEELPAVDSEAASRLRAFRIHSIFRERLALVDEHGVVLAADPDARVPPLGPWLRGGEMVTPRLASDGDEPAVALIQPVTRHGERRYLVAMMSPGSSSLATLLPGGLDGEAAMTISVVDAAGAVLGGAGAHAPGSRLEGFADLAEAISSHQAAVTTAAPCVSCERPSGERYLSVAAPLRLAPWAVLIQQPRRRAFEALRIFQWGQAAAAGLLVTFGALALRGISRSVVGPIESLSRQALRLRQGDLDSPMTVRGDQEIEVLAAALDEARLRLGATLKQLREVNENLEHLVAERTLALETQFRELEHLHQVTRHQDARRRELVRRLLTAAEEERRRLARELHDEIAQLLTAVSLSLGDSGGGDQGARSRALLARTQQEIHRIIHDLRPSLLDDLGLAAAVRGHAESHLGPAGVGLSVEVEDLGKLPGEVEISVFRIYQEIVTNVLRHSRAQTVAVELFRDRERLVLQVEDDGVGFDPEAKVDGVGLVGMRERAALVGAALTVESEPEKGTLVRLEVPLENASEELPEEASEAPVEETLTGGERP
jgi:signal transduction histidine kinase